MKDIVQILNELKNDALFLNNYTKIENMACEDYDSKLTNKIGKRIDNNLARILQNEEGLNELYKWFDNENIILRFFAARYLFPLFPKESIFIMKQYKEGLKEALDISRVNDVITGLVNHQTIFMNQFRKLYNREDLDSLNREKDM